MPELPEVETVRAGLAQHLLGAVIDDVRVFDARSLKRNFAGAEGFLREAKGSMLNAVVRRGKFLWLPVSDSRALVGHLGMSGQILVRTPDFQEDRQTRVILDVTTQRGSPLEIRFVDQRLFGGLVFEDLVETTDSGPGGFSPESEPCNLIPTNVSHIARDLLDPMFDSDFVAERMTKKNSGIKRVLLDQNLMSGIGNIYADESLWLAKLHYDQPSASITKRKHLELIQIAKEVLEKAVTQGGTSFDEQYKNINGESGYFSQSLNVYGQAGLPCKRCGKNIKREAWANRGSHFCPGCQRLRPVKRW